MRALAKELGPRGIAVNLVYAGLDTTDRLAAPVRFFCGVHTTYVTGQAVHLRDAVLAPASVPAVQALAGKVALVTGAARGIGLAIARRLVEEGARVVALDVAASRAALEAACATFGFTPLVLDITAADAAPQVAAFLQRECGGVDIVVHNAGVTRDRRLANMMEPYWDLVMDINFGAVAAIDRALLDTDVLHDAGRIVCLSSISGIAGNVGQSNYAMSKAALIGYVAAQAPRLATRGICINAVAPGFIETPMTDAMPFMLREIGRRANSLKQGGQPRDVAELVTFLATPGASGISGQTVRVCGQALIGA
jgi:3-oxoacyl-[acyl-carrier protein] reductase